MKCKRNFFTEEGEFTTWKAKVQVEPPNDDGTVFVGVVYEKKKNRKLLPDFCDDGYWGETRIIVEPGKDRGDYRWTPIKGEVFDSGENKPAGWRKKELREPRSHCRYTQQIRDEKFRPQIIALDRKCVITGETTKAALDAAHIIPAAKDGNEIPDNGITLRTDIHRLYDAGMFRIHPKSGKPKKIKRGELSPEYKKLLNREQRIASWNTQAGKEGSGRGLAGRLISCMARQAQRRRSVRGQTAGRDGGHGYVLPPGPSCDTIVRTP